MESQGLKFEAVVIGGSALNLLGVVSRPTMDCDILDPEIPKEVEEAAKRFAEEKTSKGERVQGNWFNNGPASLTDHLPEDWEKRTTLAYMGRALILRSLGRQDLLKTKLFGLCDRAADRDDCLAMRPSKLELEHALPWVEHQDANPMWPEHVRNTFRELEESLKELDREKGKGQGFSRGVS